MQFSKALISFSVASAVAVGANFFSARKAEAQPTRPYIVFVNGWQNCCASGMSSLQTRLIEEMNAEPRYVPYSNFDDGGSSGNTSTDERFLRDGANFINQLDRNRPLILIGHSFGGDSVLKLLPRIDRRIQFVAVLDPVSTGGFRSSLSGVPSNVDYFFNRWQENEPFPNDFKKGGSLQCSAKTCDQKEQQFATDENFDIVKDRCGTFETCRSKNRRIGHQSLPTDAGVQRWLGDRISEQLAAFKPTPASSPTSDSLRSLQSINFPSHYIRHANFFGYISGIDSDLSRNDATWSMVPGLANSQCTSFESKNFPGHYLRHQGLRIKLHRNDNTSLFKADATFCPRSGLADSSAFSFESVNFPNHYIRHRASELWVDPQANDELYKKDATFRITNPFIR